MPVNVAAGKDKEKEKQSCPYSCHVLSVKLEKQPPTWCEPDRLGPYDLIEAFHWRPVMLGLSGINVPEIY